MRPGERSGVLWTSKSKKNIHVLGCLACVLNDVRWTKPATARKRKQHQSRSQQPSTTKTASLPPRITTLQVAPYRKPTTQKGIKTQRSQPQSVTHTRTKQPTFVVQLIGVEGHQHTKTHSEPRLWVASAEAAGLVCLSDGGSNDEGRKTQTNRNKQHTNRLHLQVHRKRLDDGPSGRQGELGNGDRAWEKEGGRRSRERRAHQE